MPKSESKGIASYNSLLRTQINEFLKFKLKEIGREELVPSYGSLLHCIYNKGGRVQIKYLYDTLLKQRSTITEMVKRLEKLGYLIKESCPDDKRVTYVVATEKAWEFKKDFEKVSEDLLERVFQGFSEEEEDEFMRLMHKALRNFT